MSIKKGLLYLTIIAGFIGPAFFLINIGPFHLFPYRILLPLLWMLFVMTLLFNQGRVNISHIKVKSYLQFLAIWLFYAVLSLAWAVSTVDAIRDIIFLFMGISIVFFVIHYFSNLKDLKRFYTLWLLILLPLLGLGFWNHITGNHLSVSGLADAPARFRFAPTAVFHNQNDFATYLALSLPFVLTFIRYNSNFIKRFLGILMLVAGLYLIVVTFSRANYLAIIIGAAFWFFFLLKLKKKLKVAALSILLLFLLLAVFPNHLKDIASNVGVQIGGLAADMQQQGASIDIRINLVRNSFIFLGDHFGFGVGAGNVEYHMANYRVYDTGEITNVHNWWMEILANYGVFIFAGYVVFYLSLIAGLYKSYGKLRDPSEKMICEALLVGLVVFFFASMSASSIMALRPQWIFFAFALAFLNYCRIKQVREKI